ncbi:hypothetical protein ACLKA7_015660 [Drosophila subpalustris]
MLPCQSVNFVRELLSSDYYPSSDPALNTRGLREKLVFRRKFRPLRDESKDVKDVPAIEKSTRHYRRYFKGAGSVLTFDSETGVNDLADDSGEFSDLESQAGKEHGGSCEAIESGEQMVHLRGKQILACCVVACCAASAFRNLGDWTPKFLDAIVVNGDKYYRQSLLTNKSSVNQFHSGDLSMECDFQDIKFMVQIEPACTGQLYSGSTSDTMGLFEALNFFFTRYKWGILECQQHYLAFGYSSNRNGGYFLYDCAWDAPIFPDGMGATYVLRVKKLFLLLYCMVVTLNVRKRNVDFQLFSAHINRIKRHH